MQENKSVYEQAISIAANCYFDFKKALRKFQNSSDEFREYREKELVKAAAATCAQQELLCTLFFKSEEQVHDALEATLERAEAYALEAAAEG